MNTSQSHLRAAIAHAADAKLVMTRVLEASLALVDKAEGAAIELADGAGHMVYVCTQGALRSHVGLRLDAEDSLSGMAVGQRTVLQCDDSEADPRVDRQACRRVHARSMICVPLDRGAGGVAGVLKVTSAEPRAFNATDVAILENLAPFVAAAVGGATDLLRATKTLLRPLTGMDLDSPVETFMAHVLGPEIANSAGARRRIEGVLADGVMDIAVQPIIDLRRDRVTGYEALARFADGTPDHWFADAHRMGLGVELELLAVRSALALLDRLPAETYIAVNAGPQLITDQRFTSLLAASDPPRIAVELTEHVAVDDYPELLIRLNALRDRGVRVAVDDTGAGISSFAHILKLSPDLIKLDHFLTRGIDSDPVRRSLGAALVTFAAATGAQVIAEGVETAAELATLCDLNITVAQGWFLGRPTLLQPWTMFSGRPAAQVPTPGWAVTKRGSQGGSR